jgi:hypothetical protein
MHHFSTRGERDAIRDGHTVSWITLPSLRSLSRRPANGRVSSVVAEGSTGESTGHRTVRLSSARLSSVTDLYSAAERNLPLHWAAGRVAMREMGRWEVMEQHESDCRSSGTTA